MEVFQWIEETLRPAICTTDAFIYDDMDSQSGRSLPIIYEPFDACQKAHWSDRGALFDYLSSVRGEGKRLLDLGPGDGWPSLIVAPLAAEVVGVDGSQRRVSVCAQNAGRLGIRNASFVFVAPGSRLPFADESFDGAMAASSLEQTPDPLSTLGELFRVLRPGGRLRISYEALQRYAGGKEHDLWLWGIDDRSCRLILFDRDLPSERVRQYGLTYAIPKLELVDLLAVPGRSLSFHDLTAQRLRAAARSFVDARVCTTLHPSGNTLAGWLAAVGFREVAPTHSGSAAAEMLFDHLAERRPTEHIDAVDAWVRPLAEVVCQLRAPLDMDPMMTATKP